MQPDRFETLFGRPARATARAPGRFNLIGDHTDYHGGWVLPVALPQCMRVELTPSAGDVVRAYSANQPRAGQPLSYRLAHEARGRGWLDYVQGVTYALRRAGQAITGFDVYFDSDVPSGAGLSSSAALEVALLRGLRAAFELDLDDVAMAKLGRAAETDFVGVPIGIMDQMASSLADTRSALFLDTRTLRYELVPLPPAIAFVVANSGVQHSHAAGDPVGDYSTRRAESFEAARALGVPELRDVDVPARERIEQLPEPLRRRARHVVTENDRVLSAVVALRSGDGPRLGALLDQSHASLRDDYQVSVPEIDLLVAIARASPGVFGARLTGGGFGGSIVAAVDAAAASSATEHIRAEYERHTGRRITPVLCAAG